MNLINNQPDIDKIYLYERDLHEEKYQYLFNKHFDDLKAFIEYSNDMRDVFKNTEEYNLAKKHKILIVFYDAITDMINNKKLIPVVTELFIRSRKLSILIVFITQSHFKVLKDVKLNSAHFLIMKIYELQQIAINYSLNINFEDFIKIYKKCTAEEYSFLINDTTLPSDNALRFRKNILE